MDIKKLSKREIVTIINNLRNNVDYNMGKKAKLMLERKACYYAKLRGINNSYNYTDFNTLTQMRVILGCYCDSAFENFNLGFWDVMDMKEF